MMSLRRVHLPILLVLILSASGCGDEARAPGAEPQSAVDPVAALFAEGPLFPLENGTRWTYAARMGERTWEVRSKKVGGDVREREGRRIRYEFTYADLDDERRDMMKSIYALPPEGPEEFYLDAFSFSLYHNPPVPLLPSEPGVGARWTWTGMFEIEPWAVEGRELTTTLEVKGVETLDTKAGRFEAVRIDETHENLRISRWFAPDVGMVRLEVSGAIDGKAIDFAMLLTFFEAP